MKLTFIFILLGLMSFASVTYSQSARLTFESKNATIESVFKQIEALSEFKFAYNSTKLDVDKKISLKVENQTIDAILSKILGSANFQYKIVDRYIIITDENIGGNNLLEIQQQKSVSGKVTDSTGASLPGVSVVVKGTTTGVITDMDGKYSLPKVPENASLQFSFVGMKTQEIKVEGKTTINVELVDEAIGLDEVVAVGYGITKKRDLTGSISSVKADKLMQTGVTSVSQSLAGKVSGLTVTQNSAQPGGGVSWQIRGSATGRSPLIIVDGFPISGKEEPGSGNQYSSGSKDVTLNTINPNDIESVEVLKDASATSIYGSRAAGGVVIITTKRGKKGEATVEYKGSYSVQNLYNLPKMLNPQEFMQERNEVIKEVFMRSKGVAPYGTKTWAEVQSQYPGAKYSDSEIANFNGGTDWLGEVSRIGKINQHDVTMTGGSDKTKYLLSFSTFAQEGVIKVNDFKRNTGRFNLDQELLSWLKVGVSSAYTVVKDKNIPLGSGQNENAGVLRSALQFNPT